MSNIKLLTPAAILLKIKVDECPQNWSCYVLFVYNWEHENCPLHVVATSEVSATQRFLMYGSLWRNGQNF